jgi:hypothetical protein
VDKRDLGKIIQVLALAGMVALAIIFWRFNQIINPVWIPIILLLYQNLYVVPSFVEGLYRISGRKCNVVEKYCPFLNELNWMSKTGKLIQSCSLVICAFFVLLNVFPFLGVHVISDLSVSLGGMLAANTTAVWLVVFMIFFYLIFCISRGIEYVELRKIVYAEHNSLFGKKKMGAYAWIGTFLFFIPFARFFAIQDPLSLIRRMTEYNNLEEAQASLEMDEYNDEEI